MKVLYIKEEYRNDNCWEDLEVQKVFISNEEFDKLLAIINNSNETTLLNIVD